MYLCVRARRAFLPSLLASVAALCLTAVPALGADDPIEEVRSLLAEAEERLEAGDHLGVNDRMQAIQALQKQVKLPLDVYDHVFLLNLRSQVVAAHSYASGKNPGVIGLNGDEPTPERLRDAARRMFDYPSGSLRQLGEADTGIKQKIVAEPKFEALHRSPRFRGIRWSSWREPRETIWGKVELDTGDPEFEALFAAIASVPSPPQGYENEAFHAWLQKYVNTHTTAADVWVFRIRCALLNPVNQGGWPTRLGLLRQKAAVAGALAELERRAKGKPSPFQAACMVNLAVANDELDKARALLERLESGPTTFLHDFALHYAQQLAMQRLLSVRKGDEDLERFANELTDRDCAFPPAAKERRGKKRAGKKR